MTSFTRRLADRVVPFEITDEVEIMGLALTTLIFTILGTHIIDAPLGYHVFVGMFGLVMAVLLIDAHSYQASENTQDVLYEVVIIGTIVGLAVNKILLIVFTLGF